MKKILLLVSIVGMLMVGCSSKEVNTEPSKVENKISKSSDVSKKYADAPEWFYDQSNYGVASVGTAKIGKAGIQFAKTEAMSQARAEIARILEVQVKDMVKNYAKTLSNGDQDEIAKVSEQVGKQVANQSLVGSVQKGIYFTGEEVWVLVAIDETKAKAQTKTTFVSTLKNEDAMYQQFLANKADKDLDAEIDKTFNNVKTQLLEE